MGWGRGTGWFAISRLYSEIMGRTLQNKIITLLQEQGLLGQSYELASLNGDGSDRIFMRIRQRPANLIAVLPSPRSSGLREATSVWQIGRHLAASGVAVPAIHAFDPVSGLVVFTDLGDMHLHDMVLAKGTNDPLIRGLYQQALQQLVRLQINGATGFVDSWCWDTPRYDEDLMLSRESAYFMDALCDKYLGFSDFHVDLSGEFAFIAAQAARQPADFLLHRDFQSRNIIIADGNIQIIDFQGARFGPLAYDLASLLLDPYAAVDDDFADHLLAYYLDLVAREIDIDRAFFRQGYYYLYLQRNLQIMGAFAYLAGQCGKEFFRPFLPLALTRLRKHLQKPLGQDLPQLKNLADRIAKKIT